jgi:hypothetical protein
MITSYLALRRFWSNLLDVTNFLHNSNQI